MIDPWLLRPQEEPQSVHHSGLLRERVVVIDLSGNRPFLKYACGFKIKVPSKLILEFLAVEVEFLWVKLAF